jgi:hypothetical protein
MVCAQSEVLTLNSIKVKYRKTNLIIRLHFDLDR